MIVLATVNGYYSPHFPMSVMEEEDRAFHNTNFSYAEIDFFTKKLKQAYPKIDTESLTNAINFLERQKEVNCPCSIHTQKRGYDWIVFNRLPDKLSSNTTPPLHNKKVKQGQIFFNFKDTCASICLHYFTVSLSMHNCN